MTTHSQDKTKMWGVLWMVSLMTVLVSTDLPDQDCPDDCDCHYFRINWVTDCSESNLTSIPTVEEGLSLNVYVLNMNANNLDELQPFPAELKVRSLLLAENTLSMVDKENFSSLLYLIDLDLSSNNIRTIHPDAFIGQDINMYETRGRANYSTGRHRTVVYEHLSLQAGVHFLNRLPNSVKDAPMPKVLKDSPRTLLGVSSTL
ncbi:hypothetical protein J6590_100348 [Homalodisca vitripennis]|nr:hypothetical protein J6590_100348 [Homalodisca vitripennis]